jgi:general secretion pathway protein N
MLVLAGLWPRLAAADEAPAEAQSGAALVNPLAAHSLEHLSATRDRPLFAPSRRPPPPPPPVVEAVPPPPPPLPPPTLVVLGIVADANGTLAMVRSAASDKILRARLGDDIEGWKVTQIEARSLVLAHDERSVTFAMFTGAKDGADRKGGPPPSKLAVQSKVK